MTSTDQSPLLDLELVNELAAVPGLLGDVIEVFARVAHESIETLSSSILRGDRDEVRRVAHALKGAAAQVGAARLSASAAKIERAMKDGGSASAVELPALLHESLDELRKLASVSS